MELPRIAADMIERSLRVSPVVVVMGARQTGKSTLVRGLPMLRDYPYLTLEDLDIREEARTASDVLVGRAPRMVIDEVQREADLVLAIKRVVDQGRPRVRGQFVLTGSANLLLMNRVSETLAGRATYVTLRPLTRRERLGQGRAGNWDLLFTTPVHDWYDLMSAEKTVLSDWRDEVRLGGYPTPAYELQTNEERAIWFAGYVRTYLERDLQDLAAIDSLVDFRRLMRAVCLRVGNLMNQSELSRDTGIPQPSVHRYLNLLETSYRLIRLEPYSVNRTKRLVKTPKAFWSDTALAMFLAGESEPRGAHLENLVLTDLVAWCDALIETPNVLYWRTSSGTEVDFVVERGDELLAIEVKSGTRPSHRDTAGIRAFMEEYGERVRGGLILHTGEETYRLAPNIVATSVWNVL